MTPRIWITAAALAVTLTGLGPVNAPSWAHGSNSPVVDGAVLGGRAFHELNLMGTPNAVGLTVTSARARQIELRDATGASYVIRIASVGTTPMLVGKPDQVPTYRMTYTSPAQPVPQPLCASGSNEAITFTGDRYDAKAKTVIATGLETRGWMNIACDGTALAKLYLTRHTEASQHTPTTRAERQAMLKMLTGDVCGDGTPYTVAGQPLLWKDEKQVTAFTAQPASIEAVWSDAGAVCLDVPRRPELAAAIVDRCGRLPRCSASTLGYVTSANP